MDLKTGLDGVAQKYKDTIPSNEMLLELLLNENVISLAEYVSAVFGHAWKEVESGVFIFLGLK